MEDLVIIGSGPSALFAVFQAGILGIKSCVIDLMANIGGQCNLYLDKNIYDIPAHPCITARQLVQNLQQQAQKFSPRYLMSKNITLIKNEDDHVSIHLDDDPILRSKSVIIASGNGAITYNKPSIEQLSDFEGKSIHYSVEDINTFKNKKVGIAGGGDSAADWCIMLADIADSVFWIHRRANFRCAPNSLKTINDLIKEKKVELITPYQISSVYGSEGKLSKVLLRSIPQKHPKSLEIEHLLLFFGLKSSNSFIKKWGLKSCVNGNIEVNKTNMKTNIERVYAIGDAASYDGKLKLILSGFAEAATACHDIYNLLNPDNKLRSCHSSDNPIFAS